MQFFKKSYYLTIATLLFSFVFGVNAVMATSTVTTTETGDVVSINLNANASLLQWTVEGYSEKGFKVVFSKTPNPTYPLRSTDKYNYYPKSDSRSDSITAFDGDGIYYARVCEYLGGKCGVYSNEVKVEFGDGAGNPTICTMEYAPVCGTDGKTYSNKCGAGNIAIDYQGPCKELEGDGVESIAAEAKEVLENFKEKAESLAGDKFEALLVEMEQLRDQVKEQATKIKHLEGLMKNVAAVSERMQDAISNFITYGVDENTKDLGEGERAAVMNSFKAAFGKLPENDTDIEDAIKIANGRWPTLKSEAAEMKAKEAFEEIYKRAADMENPNDNAAITVMSYGLRQKAQNRNLNSEKQGIKTFQHIFGHVPSTTEEWNTMQAITYSGATR